MVHDSRVQSVMVMKSRQQELKAASWSQGIHKDATTQPAFSFYVAEDPSPEGSVTHS